MRSWAGLGAYPNFVGPASIDRMWTAGCCTGNGTSGIYYAWDAITRCQGDSAQVNLFLNRAAPWLDIDSYLPYEGRVVIHNKLARRLAVRVPPWVNRSQLEWRVNGECAHPGWVASYAQWDGLKPGDTVQVAFPLVEKTLSRTAHSGKPDQATYSIHMRGNTVLDISPRDELPQSYPIYRREHLKGSKAPMKKVIRFVSPINPKW